ncbi:hypothetical protein [Paenibacillus sp. Z6-24]
MNILTARRPAGTRDFIGIILSLVVLTCLLGNLAFTTYRRYWYAALLVLLIVSIAYLFIIIGRRIRRPFEILLKDDAMVIGDQQIESTAIRQILLKGYERPVIGIQSSRNVILPTGRCFVLTDDTEQGLEQLSRWANQHGIRVMNKPFIRWI